ncbi:MAG: PAS domain-containing protein [Magnetococcales bacterium]|nr:PAS domain-containing protein [Magnetococcales bacterium]
MKIQYFNQLKQLTLLRFLILIFFGLVVQKGYLGVGWSQFVPWNDNYIYLYSTFLLVLTLANLFWLKVGKHIEMFTKVQCALDPVLITVLILTTGGLSSPFYFLFGVAILNTAFLLGQRQAFIMAGMILICSVGLVTLIPVLNIFDFKPEIGTINILVFQGIALILTALLAGALARRIGGIQKAFLEQTDSLTSLTSLHHQITQAIPHALVSVNIDGLIRDVNPSAEQILNISANEVYNRSLKQFFPALHWAVEHIDRDNIYMEFKQNGIILGVNISTLIDKQNVSSGALLVIKDLTTIKGLEAKVVNQEKISLTGQMAAGVAHEIRNPLASILSATQMFGEETPRNVKLKGIIIEEVERLKKLTTDFLHFSRPTSPTRQKIDLLDFLNNVTKQIKIDPSWGENRQLNINIPPQTAVLFDSDQLQQIFWNLLINAAQAAPNGGKITIDLDLSPNKSQQLIVVVEDDGPGLDNKIIGKVLEPFFTTRSEGTGLGLAVVTQLARMNGGLISLQPGKNRGLRVLLTVEKANV